MKKAAFLDRDGVINRKAPEGRYITRWEEMHFLPGVHEAIRSLNEAGFLVIVVSNQRCVAKRLITTQEVDALHALMLRELQAADARIDAIYFCPHDYQPPCRCRKPQPGMLLDAAQKYDINLAASWMIGDSPQDGEAGRSAGCKTARVTVDDRFASGDFDISGPSLLSVVHRILQFSNSLS
jgi:D-glycero-D-manno-heptose 1,7-bisphosphate phosphatase